MIRSTFAIPLAALMLWAYTPHAAAQFTEHTWIGGASGSGLLWNSDANWSPSAAPADGNATPNNGNLANGERAIIGNATGDREILTPLTATTIVALSSWTQSSNFVNKITLQNNLTAARNESATWGNTSGSAANMVLDLNGFTFSRNHTSSPSTTSGYTILSSSGIGVWRQIAFASLNVNTVVGPNVTLEAYGAGTSVFPGSWDPSTTVIISAPVVNHAVNSLSNTTGIGNLIVGLPTNTAPTGVITFIQSQAVNIIRGDVTINTYVGAVGGDASDITFGGTITNEVRVGGNWIDYATDSSGYGGAPSPGRHAIVFNGSPITQRTVSIGRTGLVNDFAVGVSASDTGNIVLDKDLTTTGRFTVRVSSTLNVADKTLTVGEFVGNAGARYTYTAGDDTGLIAVNGNLTLNAFTLNIERAGNWDYLQDLVLFTYTGTFSGSPVLTLGSLPGGFTYGQLLTDGGVVRLTSVGLPEPTSVVALLGGLLLVAPRSRRRAR